MKMDEQHLHRPLLPLSTTTAATTDVRATTNTSSKVISSNFGIAFRLLLIILVGGVSMWANQEASKGFVITVVDDMKNNPLGEKFSLFYVSNDEVTRLVQGAYDFATKFLYSDTMHEKAINQVDIQLVNTNLTHDHIVVDKHLGQTNKYVISISPLIMEYRDFRYRIRKDIQRCMTKILLFDGKKAAPKVLLDGMIEYISSSAGFGGPKPVMKSRGFSGKCWEDKDPKVVARFLDYCERKSKGFLGRLNEGMKERWDEGMVDRALGMPAIHFCKWLHYSLMRNEDLMASDSISSYR